MENLKHRCRRDGFTLIEMLIVVGIIALLVSIVVVGGIGWINRAKQQQTKLTLATLDAIVDEYHTEMGRYFAEVSDPERPGQRIRLDDLNKVPYARRMGLFLDEAQEVGEIFKIVGGLHNETWDDRDADTNTYQQKQVLDAWGKPVQIVFKLDQVQDLDLVPKPQNFRPWFVSAGEDGEFGEPTTTSTQPSSETQKRDAEDNVFSESTPASKYFIPGNLFKVKKNP